MSVCEVDTIRWPLVDRWLLSLARAEDLRWTPHRPTHPTGPWNALEWSQAFRRWGNRRLNMLNVRYKCITHENKLALFTLVSIRYQSNGCIMRWSYTSTNKTLSYNFPHPKSPVTFMLILLNLNRRDTDGLWRINIVDLKPRTCSKWMILQA